MPSTQGAQEGGIKNGRNPTFRKRVYHQRSRKAIEKGCMLNKQKGPLRMSL
ncbi:hypothetical protein O176_00365 [Chlamydia trachomatis]|nr:hypothetical protein CTLINITIAL_01700 [Chlamydia trachomatis L2/434/Bu(i)]AGJ65360.1 hypothetical protein CTLFINAL_01700 [Chlamydia trachomatis L2/434/Bu(f)]AGR93481.1 hypothetical protein CTRC69_00350 [Chlamydia trachomatis RC-F/69]AGR94405.1 hypothetical protein CTRC46_00350 [Chlamydia trachomatis RC-L2(s)/46]AGR96283.1 hypothetical protein CTRC943_00345 [Chlamydia trachomatis RC-J/943]AGR97210.1 hypothetical protein CTRC953_00350 [Chlamydia trachomatis RC-J/953]AGR98130.1 hypothetical p